MEEEVKEHWLEEKVHWITKNYKSILGVFCAFCLVCFFMFRSKGDRDYFRAENFAIEYSSSQDIESFDKLCAIVKKHPELREKYHAVLNEGFQEKKNIKQLKRLLNKNSYYLKKQFPHHEAFSKISLSIEEAKYSQALEQTLNLKEQLHKDSLEDGILYKLNDYRLAFLQEKLGKKEQLSDLYESISTDIPFTEQKMAFSDLVQEKKRELR